MKKQKTWGEQMKQTAYNITHANQLAKQKEAAEKRASRNAVLGGGGIIISVIVSTLINKTYWKLYIKRNNSRLVDLERKISATEDAVNDLVNDIYTTDEVTPEPAEENIDG